MRLNGGMNIEKINLKEKLSLFSEYWSPKIITELNDYQIKLVKIKDKFVWHNHENTDELFLVIEGNMKIEFKDKTIHLNEGEMYVVPKGIEHRPYAENECKIMLIEPKGVINTGKNKGELTAKNDVWI
jgi:mannose-6-phosphate isomerase-like protein (cupin superfamily)